MDVGTTVSNVAMAEPTVVFVVLGVVPVVRGTSDASTTRLGALGRAA